MSDELHIKRARRIVDDICQEASLDPSKIAVSLHVSQEERAYHNASIRHIDPFIHGKSIQITFGRGFLETVDDAELRFTTAHEIGHLVLGHLPSIDGNRLISAEQSRAEEFDADEFAVSITGEPDTAIDFVETFVGSHEKAVAALSEGDRSSLSHPHPYERMDHLRKQFGVAAANPAGNVSPPPSLEPSAFM